MLTLSVHILSSPEFKFTLRIVVKAVDPNSGSAEPHRFTPLTTVSCSSLIGQMLQRDPKNRTSLELIEEHEWLQGVDPSPATKLATPLVSHRSLSEEEHGCIVQRLVLGGIADRDDITEYASPTRRLHGSTKVSGPFVLELMINSWTSVANTFKRHMIKCVHYFNYFNYLSLPRLTLTTNH